MEVLAVEIVSEEDTVICSLSVNWVRRWFLVGKTCMFFGMEDAFCGLRLI
ncbi:hypothetical protein ACU8KH_03920 [Lachancea thermotolerans]